MVVVVPSDLAIQPSHDEIRTDVEGHFRVVTETPAFVVRKPGYVSERVIVRGDAHLSITLRGIASTSRCKLSKPPDFKTKAANDVDCTATWFYIETKHGAQGIISGNGPNYSWGAPSDKQVWTSVEYSELMYDSARSMHPDFRLMESTGVCGACSARLRNTTTKLDKTPNNSIA
jgi:hypothetical protein